MPAGRSSLILLRDAVGADMSAEDHTRALELYRQRSPFNGSPAMRWMKRNPGAPSAH